MDEIFSWFIRSAVMAPRGQPSPNWLDAFHRAYHQHELKKCFSEKKINAVDGGAKKRIFKTGGIIT